MTETPRQKEERENYKNEVFQDQWLEFMISGNPLILANIVENYCDFDPMIKGAVVERLKFYGEKKKWVSGNHYRSFEIYSEVERLMKSHKISKRQACSIYEEKHGLTLRTIQNQHTKGSEIANLKNGIFSKIQDV